MAATAQPKEKKASPEFRRELMRLTARMLGQRFVFPDIPTAVGEFKAALTEFDRAAAKAEREDKEALVLVELLCDQSRTLGEKDTGKEFGQKLGAAYCDLVAMRAGL